MDMKGNELHDYSQLQEGLLNSLSIHLLWNLRMSGNI